MIDFAETCTRIIQTVPFRNSFQQTDVDKGTQTATAGFHVCSGNDREIMVGLSLNLEPSPYLQMFFIDPTVPQGNSKCEKNLSKDFKRATRMAIMRALK